MRLRQGLHQRSSQRYRVLIARADATIIVSGLLNTDGPEFSRSDKEKNHNQGKKILIVYPKTAEKQFGFRCSGAKVRWDASDQRSLNRSVLASVTCASDVIKSCVKRVLETYL